MSKKIAAGAAAMISGAMVLTACGGGPSSAGGDFTDNKVVLAVLNDQSGVYKDLSGPNSVKAVEMAVADYKEKYGDKAVVDDIEVTSADHQNDPEIANTKAQELYDREGADVILDVPTSSAALAVASQAKAKKKLFLDIGAGTTELTGASCNKYTFHWAYDTYMLAHGTGTTVTENGGKKWELVYPDYAFGQDMTKSFTDAVEGAGGSVEGTIATPFPNDNFATFLTKAASKNPDVIGTMHAGGDLINFVKQFNEGGYKDQGINLAVGLMFITDIHSLGVKQFAGTQFTDAWYWNYDDENRKWADRFKDETGTRPSFAHAGNYSAATAVPRGRPVRGHRRRRQGRRRARGQEGRRRLPPQRRDPRRGPQRRPRRLPRHGEGPRGRLRGVGLRGDHRHHPGGRGLHACLGVRLLDELTTLTGAPGVLTSPALVSTPGATTRRKN